MSENIIEVKNLKKYFPTPGGALHAVDNVDFHIKKQTTFGVVGESGCGKSTLGRTLIGLTPASSGEIFFKGQDITNIKGAEKKKLCTQMQMIFQDPFSCLDPRLCVRDLIAEPLDANRIYSSKKERNDRVKELMDTVGLSERFELSFPHELDGGRRQRIGIARALALNPDFIVCDEPVSALDVSIQAQILNLLQDLQEKQGLTYMFITHNLSVVKHISEEILVMYMGCVVETCSKEELFTHCAHPYTKGVMSAIPIPDVDHKKERIIMEGEVSSPINPKPGCRFAVRCPFATEICCKKRPVLRQIAPEHWVACHNI